MKTNYLLDEKKDSQHLDLARHTFLGRYDIARLAKKLMLKSPAILYNRLNPEMEYHHLSVELLEQLTNVTGDKVLIEGLNKDLGLTVHEIPSSDVTDENIVKMIFRRQKLNGDFSGLYEKAVDDGKLDNDEIGELVEHLDDAMSHLAKLKANLLAQSKEVA